MFVCESRPSCTSGIPQYQYIAFSVISVSQFQCFFTNLLVTILSASTQNTFICFHTSSMFWIFFLCETSVVYTIYCTFILACINFNHLLPLLLSDIFLGEHKTMLVNSDSLRHIYCSISELLQVAQLSQRDRAAGWVNGQKWKTGTERQYLRTI